MPASTPDGLTDIETSASSASSATDHPLADEILRHYTTRWDESKRLSTTIKGNLERTRLHDFLTQYLPETPARVADIGGGPGAHAIWMQEQGYNVCLLDPVQHHIDQAQQAGIASVLGDARRLPWGNEAFGAALLAGPLYHLVDGADRRLALREAIRVPRPGGVVRTIAINRASNLIAG